MTITCIVLYRDESDDYDDDDGDDELFSAFCPPTPDTSHNWWDCGHQNDTQIHHKGVEAHRADDADAAFIYGNLPMAKVLDKNSK